MLGQGFATDNPHLVVPTTVTSFPHLMPVIINDTFNQSVDTITQWLSQPGYATAYAGHQFGHFAPLLGDGRAVLLGDIDTATGRLEVQAKGAGRTYFSRRGDGRLQLEPALREYLFSEWMHALGVPTTRSLAVLTTGETIHRDTAQPGALLIRLAQSHVRIGTVEYAARHSPTVLADLVQHTADVLGLDPHTSPATVAIDLLREVCRRQAALLAAWMRYGFVHGVINTDNVALSGETLDYGPCALIDRFDPQAVFSRIDTAGRYRYGAQAHINQWNLMVLAQALSPLAPMERLTAVLAEFASHYHDCYFAQMRQALGLAASSEADELVADFVTLLSHKQPDYHETLQQLAATPEALPSWLAPWGKRWLAADPNLALMRNNCPQFIPRHYVLAEIIAAAVAGDYEPFHKAVARAQHPYTGAATPPPPPGVPPTQTVCGI
ncbi:protein adenylyltransferase SelO family protein [Corynebacterium choanae]|uniref:Protein nucleotidyltransferase YdiU n=1 Tax=Corynebacterium choanae TaxID=1862358 RepID=A0A3G6J490_9CORY|nr:protein adenylyltransferase SelO family protein [Corynebacterium choanae]AZA12895.1 hypothetical protein CCHOA_02390 [Corynebacterium choanae]